ncbi:MAG: aminotransferase class I/II-fold pyridoxal phosphate-dependent enzyme [Oscillospiraceae bacterium]|nr:aminotransferase class I/II-fold pyridoxal phosphate-dependent enzyme [Oscillospiraceae bacterium]
MRDALNAAVYGARRSAIREFSRMAKETPGCVALTLGEPDFNTPTPVSRQVQAAVDAGETHYIENNGAAALRAEIASFERNRHGMDYGEHEVIVTAGATEALFVSLFGILNPGDEVIVPTPAFVLYEEIIKLCRGVFVPLDTTDDGFQIDPDKLRARISPRTKAVILNSPNNPTGCVYTAESLRAVRDVVAGKPIFVLCDDVYRQLVYTGEYHSFSEFRELREQLLVIQSFSKPYAMTGWRMGYLLCDAQIKERLELVHQFMVVSTPSLFQRACIEALQYDPAELVETYRRRRAYVLERLSGMGLETQRPDGAFYVFPSIAPFGLDSATFCRRMIAEAGLAATPGFCFGSDRHIRLTYCYGDSTLREGMDRLQRFLFTLNKKKE